MVGDSLEMDIRGAANAGFAAAVLVTGGNDKEGAQQRIKAGFGQCQRDDDHDDKKGNATDDDDDGGESSVTCFANDPKRSGSGSNIKTLLLQCSTVAQVPILLRRRQMLF